jgi:hypothetical protein
MTTKLTKKELINDINIFFLKQGKACDVNLFKISKSKLIEIVIENDIPHIDKDALKAEIEETEKFNHYLQVIYHNFMKYKNVPVEVIRDLNKNSNVTTKELYEIIQTHNLKFDDNMKETNDLVSGLVKVLNDYYLATSNHKYDGLKTIPDIIQRLIII